MQATITAQYVNQVKPGKKWGSIKDTGGVMYGCPPALLPLFVAGGMYTIEFEMSGDFRRLLGIVNAPGAAAPPVAQQPMGQPQQPAVYQPPAATTMVQPPRSSGPALPTTGIIPAKDTKSEDMAVMGIIGRCFQGTGTLPSAGELAGMIGAVRWAWNNPTPVSSEPVQPPGVGLDPDDDGLAPF